MTLEYRGNRSCVDGGRMAAFCFDTEKEEARLEKIIAELKKNDYWKRKGFDWFDTCVVMFVIDKDDFNDLMAEYKKSKNILNNFIT